MQSFTECLRQGNAQTWEGAVEHRFVKQLAEGVVPEPVMASYLIQDHRFLDSFLALVGAAVSQSDTFDARVRLARFAGDLAGDENDYFLRAFDALGVGTQHRGNIPDSVSATRLKQLHRDAADSADYVAILAVLVVSEWLYLDWATRVRPARPRHFVHAEWIDLHDNPGFTHLVAFLRSELDRVGPRRPEVARDYFGRAVDLELQFFDEAYTRPFVRDAE